METRPYVPWELMGNFMIDVFKAYGVPEEDARLCADVLLESDRRGIESHGSNRFKPIYIDRIVKGTLLPKTELEIVKETPTTVVSGTETVQVYVKALDYADAPLKSLRGFKKVVLEPGETEKAEITLDGEAFEYYDPSIDELSTRAGRYEILYGTSSMDKDLKSLAFEVK